MSDMAPETSRIAAAKERAEHAKTVILAAAVIAFFGAIALERGAHAATSSSLSRRRATSATFAPRPASAAAVAAPIPLEAPVTSATVPASAGWSDSVTMAQPQAAVANCWPPSTS